MFPQRKYLNTLDIGKVGLNKRLVSIRSVQRWLPLLLVDSHEIISHFPFVKILSEWPYHWCNFNFSHIYSSSNYPEHLLDIKLNWIPIFTFSLIALNKIFKYAGTIISVRIYYILLNKLYVEKEIEKRYIGVDRM